MRILAWTYCNCLTYQSVRGKVSSIQPFQNFGGGAQVVCSICGRPFRSPEFSARTIRKFLCPSYSFNTMPQTCLQNTRNFVTSCVIVLLDSAMGSDKHFRTCAAFASHSCCSAAHKTLVCDILRTTAHKIQWQILLLVKHCEVHHTRLHNAAALCN